MAGQPPNVLVLIKGLGIGGAEKLVSEGARLWDRSRFNYRVAYVLPWKDQLVPEIEGFGFPVVCIGEPKGNSLIAWMRLLRLVRDWDIDLIHAHLPMTGVLARMTGRPVVYTEHNLADSYRQPTRTLNRVTYRLNRAVIAVSEAVANSLGSHRARNLQVVPNGVSVDVDPAAVGAARAELSLNAGDALVVHVGNIRPHKGHSNLVAMAAELRKSRQDVTIVSIGAPKHEDDLIRLRTEAEQLGLGDTLRFLGRRSDALAFMAAADVYVNPADVEGLPVTILEAMSLGAPVVATDVGGVSTVVRNHETGFLVPARQPGALASAVDHILTDRGQATKLGNAGRELVERNFGLEAMVRSVEKVYEQVLDG